MNTLGCVFLCASLATACTSQKDRTGNDTGANPDTGTPPASSDAGVWHDPCPRDDFEQRMINVGEVALNVACRGSGETTVVFLHGFPEFYYSWNAVMDALVEDYRVIAPDQRGYNRSDKPEDVADYELPLLTADIVNCLLYTSPSPRD